MSQRSIYFKKRLFRILLTIRAPDLADVTIVLRLPILIGHAVDLVINPQE